MTTRHGDVPLEEALDRAHGLAVPLRVELVPLETLAGRLLAQDVRARVPIPPATNSAMDGWAVRAADTPGALVPVGESAAGHPWAGTVGPGQACRISTGAWLPGGADAVVRREDCREEAGLVHVVRPAPGQDLRRAGEDLPAGAVALPAGRVVAPHEVGVVAACGRAAAVCRVRPRVVVVATGEELAAPGGDLPPGAVFDANRFAVAAQARAAGAEVAESRVVGDDRAAVRRVLAAALAAPEPPDLLVTSGGVSVGEHDHVRGALADLGWQEVVGSLRMRPGHPTTFGLLGGVRVLGLPGNPVSAMVAFHVVGRPLLGHGRDWTERRPLAAAQRKRAGDAALVRCRLAGESLEPLRRQGSGDVSSLAAADALAWLPAQPSEVGAGTVVPLSRL